MNTAQLTDAFKSKYHVVSESISGNGCNLITSVGVRYFAACIHDGRANVYPCYLNQGEWVFLPGVNGVKSLAGIDKFIKSRTKYD